MGSGALCASGILRKENPAPQARIACRLSLPRAPWARSVRGFNPAGQPAFKRAYRIRGARRFLWEVIHSIISGGFYGKSVRFVWAVTCMRTAPRPPYWRGAAWVQAQPAASYDGGGFLWEVGTSYNERRFLWEAARFAWAVTCMRRPPRPVGAKCTRVQPGGQCPHLCTAIWRRRFLWGVMRPIMSGGFYEKRYALFGLYLA